MLKSIRKLTEKKTIYSSKIEAHKVCRKKPKMKK